MAHIVPTRDQLQYIAHGSLAGRDASTLSAATGLTVANVTRIIERRKMKPDLLAVYDGIERNFRKQIEFGDVRHLQEMQDMTGEAYRAISFALTDRERDPRLAVDTAWKVLRNSGVDVQEEGAAGSVEVNSQVNFFGEKTQQVLDVVSSSIASTTAEMGFRLPPVGAPSKHRRISEAESVTSQQPVEMHEPVDAEIVSEETGLPAKAPDES